MFCKPTCLYPRKDVKYVSQPYKKVLSYTELESYFSLVYKLCSNTSGYSMYAYFADMLTRFMHLQQL